MNTTALRTFLSTNAIPYYLDGFSYDINNKKKWLRQGVSALREMAKNIGATAEVHSNASGSIDRGYVTGFIAKNGKVVYVSINDGMRDILYRTAKHMKDYTGGSNNTVSLSGMGWESMEQGVKRLLE